MLLALIITALLFGLTNVGRARRVQSACSTGLVLLSTGLLAYALLG